MAFNKYGVPEEPNVRVLSPPDYQTVHRWDDTAAKIEAHVPRTPSPGVCECGARFPTDQAWAEHLADVLLGHPRRALLEATPARGETRREEAEA